MAPRARYLGSSSAAAPPSHSIRSWATSKDAPCWTKRAVHVGVRDEHVRGVDRDAVHQQVCGLFKAAQLQVKESIDPTGTSVGEVKAGGAERAGVVGVPIQRRHAQLDETSHRQVRPLLQQIEP